MLPQFESRVVALAQEWSDTSLHAAVYLATLRHLLDHPVPGGCHLFAAILYVLFVEAEAVVASPGDTGDDAVEYRMCIGVARSPDSKPFDHSWVEAGPLIYDVAVCLPLDGGHPTGGPVFASHDLLTSQWVHRAYLQFKTDSLELTAEQVAGWSLAEYGEEIWVRDRRRLWEIIATIGSEVGFSFEPAALEIRHGSALRFLVPYLDSPESHTC